MCMALYMYTHAVFRTIASIMHECILTYEIVVSLSVYEATDMRLRTKCKNM